MDHPNIIKYYDSFIDSEGALCIATTYCEGEQLQLAAQLGCRTLSLLPL
jgi:serine/threonine protein kinase